MPELIEAEGPAHDFHGGAAGSFASEGCVECQAIEDEEIVGVASRSLIRRQAAQSGLEQPGELVPTSPEAEPRTWTHDALEATSGDRKGRCLNCGREIGDIQHNRQPFAEYFVDEPAALSVVAEYSGRFYGFHRDGWSIGPFATEDAAQSGLELVTRDLAERRAEIEKES